MGLWSRFAVSLVTCLSLGSAQAALLQFSQNPNVTPGLHTYQAVSAIPVPHQVGGPATQRTFNPQSLVRSAMQLSLQALDVSDFTDPSGGQGPVDLYWKMLWIDPDGDPRWFDEIALCWENCSAGTTDVQALKISGAQALSLANSDGIYPWLGGFDVGTWEVQAFFDFAPVSPTPGIADFSNLFASTTFNVPVLPTAVLVLSGLLLLRRRV